MIQGFQDGADDYIIKPFELEVLHSRICAILRRIGSSYENILICGAITIDKNKLQVFYEQEKVVLSSMEYQLILALMEHKNHTLTRKMLRFAPLINKYIFRLEAIFMLPVYSGGHSAYQDFVVTNLRKYFPNPDSVARSTWDIIDHFFNLDLSFTDDFLKPTYSVFGPKPRTPSCMQRSYLLSIDFKVTSLTDWAAQLKINPLFAILSHFEFGDTPGVGTFYDFLSRMWNSKDDHLSSHTHPLKMKVKKPKKKGSKADSIEKVTVAQLLPELEHTVFQIDDQPYASLFQLFTNEFLHLSVSNGLIKPESLALAGEGTPVVTSHRERKHRVCDCALKGITDCKCDRYFSQPDCDIGWDSSRDCYYHVYDLYMLVAMKDNPRLFNNPPRDSKKWKLEYNARTSSERSNKRVKIDFKLEDGRHRSTKMWYCRLYHILMLQHLDAWDMPFESDLRKLILQAA